MTASKTADVAQNVANINVGVTTSIGFMAFLNENAAALGLLVSFGTALAAVTFYILSYRLNKKLKKQKWLDELLDKAKETETYDIRKLTEDE